MLKNYTTQNNANSQNTETIRKLIEIDFKERFKSDPSSKFDSTTYSQILDPIISQRDNTELCTQVMDQEIHDAVLQLDRDKSPGPDGYPALFLPKVLVDNWKSNH